jgi:hypothetical protein
MFVDVRIIYGIRKHVESADTCSVWRMEVEIADLVGWTANQISIRCTRCCCTACNVAYAQSPTVLGDQSWTLSTDSARVSGTGEAVRFRRTLNGHLTQCK